MKTLLKIFLKNSKVRAELWPLISQFFQTVFIRLWVLYLVAMGAVNLGFYFFSSNAVAAFIVASCAVAIVGQNKDFKKWVLSLFKFKKSWGEH